MTNREYKEREYRNWIKSKDLISFQVSEYETDLNISANKKLEGEALKSIHLYRSQLIDYTKEHKEFETSFKPIELDTKAPNIIKDMYLAGQKARVGPFAAVAGAMAEYVGKDLLSYTPEIIVENGGDIFIYSKTARILGIFAGQSPLTGKIGIKITPDIMPLGVCTSSGTVGHSTSLGKADAVIVISQSTPLADAVATATANLVQNKESLEEALNYARNIEGILGAIAIIDIHVGAWGQFEIVKTFS